MKYELKKDYSFWKLVRSYLHEYMPLIRNLSPNTITAYKLSISLFLQYIREKEKITNDKITFEIFKRDNLKDFIVYLKEKEVAPKTINLRMTSIKAFLKYASEEDFELRVFYNEASSIKQQKCPKRPIEYLQHEATKAILEAFPNDTRKHCRNRMLLILMYHLGTRVY